MCSPDQLTTEARLSALPSALAKGMEGRVPRLPEDSRLRSCGPLAVELVWCGRCQRRHPSKYRPAAVVMRLMSFLRDQLLDRRTRSASLDQSGLLIEPPQRTKFFFPPQFRSMNGGLQHAYCLVVNPQRHWKGMSVFASMREREPCGVREAIRGSVNNFGDHRQRTD